MRTDRNCPLLRQLLSDVIGLPTLFDGVLIVGVDGVLLWTISFRDYFYADPDRRRRLLAFCLLLHLLLVVVVVDRRRLTVFHHLSAFRSVSVVPYLVRHVLPNLVVPRLYDVRVRALAHSRELGVRMKVKRSRMVKMEDRVDHPRYNMAVY